MLQRLQHCIPKTYLEHSISCISSISSISTVHHSSKPSHGLQFFVLGFEELLCILTTSPRPPQPPRLFEYHTLSHLKPVRWTCISAWLDIKYCGKIFALEESSWPEGSWNMLLGVDVSVKPWKEAKLQNVLAKRSLKCSRTQETYVLWASFKCRVSKARNEVLTKAPAATQYVLLVTKAQNVLLNGDLCTSAA